MSSHYLFTSASKANSAIQLALLKVSSARHETNQHSDTNPTSSNIIFKPQQLSLGPEPCVVVATPSLVLWGPYRDPLPHPPAYCQSDMLCSLKASVNKSREGLG